MANASELIIGTWRLVHSIQINSEGESEYPLGKNAKGYIYYNTLGVMAVQITAQLRTEHLESVSQLKKEYLAYFGRYEIDGGKQLVRHFVDGQLFPGDHPDVLERSYHFEGDLMYLKPLDGTHREILWSRCNK